MLNHVTTKQATCCTVATRAPARKINSMDIRGTLSTMPTSSVTVERSAQNTHLLLMIIYPVRLSQF